MSAIGSRTKEEDKLSSTALRYCRRFSLDEIRSATEDFNDQHLIGQGGFGKVYKGQIDHGRQQTVAMKRLAPNSNQGEDEFLMEIETLGKLRHINLVSLIGYCSEEEEMILVYEYIARGTLTDHLYRLPRSNDNNGDLSSLLTWKQRLNICIGAGRGIDYLHTGSSIIHRDVKSSNILLDENFTAKVSDFGLAKHLSTKSHVSTIVKGSFGYLDPSYFTTCRLTRKSDIYAFGVVMLEVLCGRPAVDQRLGEDEMSLALWALEKISKGKAVQIVASNLRDEISADCLKTFVGIAKKCLNHEPKKRPTMCQVVVQLEFALIQQDKNTPTLKASWFLPFWNKVKPSDSRATGSTQEEHKQGDVNTLSTAITATQEEALNGEQTVDKLPVAVPAIPILKLENITDNFSSKCLIDKITGGMVYRGTLEIGRVAAIKPVNFDGHEDVNFLEQVLLLSSLKHENVAQLLGYCLDGHRKFLVYEFAQNGSLYDILHGDNVSKPVGTLSWFQRVKIALAAAKGLEYIHEKAHIHYDIRSANILVYNDDDVKLAGFGLPTDHAVNAFTLRFGDYHPCAVLRLFDYHAPEYLWDGIRTWRNDVYSFGWVLLELLTGRTVIDYERPTWRERFLSLELEKATLELSDYEVRQIVDPNLKGDYPRKGVAKMAVVVALCVSTIPERRPRMHVVVEALHSLLKNCSARRARRIRWL